MENTDSNRDPDAADGLTARRHGASVVAAARDEATAERQKTHHHAAREMAAACPDAKLAAGTCRQRHTAAFVDGATGRSPTDDGGGRLQATGGGGAESATGGGDAGTARRGLTEPRTSTPPPGRPGEPPSVAGRSLPTRNYSS